LDCKESQNLMAAYIDGELDSPTSVHYAAHLEGCPDCNDAYLAMLELHTAIVTHATAYTAPSYLRHRIRTALPRPTRREKLSKLPWAWINFGSTVTCSLTLAFTFSLYMAVPSAEVLAEQEISGSHARSLMQNHLSDVVSTDQHTVKPWFTDKLDYSPTVYDFAPEGYALLGGRLDYMSQRPVAAMAYQHKKHLLNLFVWPDKEHNNAPQVNSSRQGYQMIHWTQDGMRYWLISDVNAQDLGDFKRMLATQIDKDSRQ
jgi:anti-sigma factor RsiW